MTISDPHAQTKSNRFVGICIERKGCGLRAEFTLRNVVDHQGVEVSNINMCNRSLKTFADKKEGKFSNNLLTT